MDSPTFNLFVFVIIVAFASALLWPRVGFIHLLRGRMRMTKRTLLEDALKYVHNCDSSDMAASIESLAKSLEISFAKVSKLVDQMSRASLVSVVDERIFLTEEGKKYALQIIRAHRLWERYLADETGIEPKEWHTQAEEHEHLLSLEEANALSDRLGNPRFDPHGDPIPTADGELIQEKLPKLTEMTVGEYGTVSHMEDEPEEVYEQLISLDIFVGMAIRLKNKADDYYMVEAEGRDFRLSPEAAGNLSIKPVESALVERMSASHESLADLRPGEVATVMRISPACRGFERRRLMDLGVLPSTLISYYKNGLTGGLTAFNVRGTVLALRFEQARMIAIYDRKKVEA